MVVDDEIVTSERVSIKPNRINKIKNQLNLILNSKVLPYLVLLFCVTPVLFAGAAPFAYLMLGVAAVFNIPLLLPLVVTVVSMLVFGVGSKAIVSYSIFHVVYAIITIVITSKNISKKKITLIKLGISTLISGIICMLIYGFTSDSFIMLLVQFLSIASFYPVFISGSSMLFYIRKHFIFSKEEIISLGIVLIVAITLLSKVTIMGFSLSCVLGLILVVVIGWRNDWITGTATGVIMGLIYSIITHDTSLTVVTFGFSGLASGVLSKFGKVYVALAFLLGNIALAYLYNVDILMWSKLAEILVSSAIIVALPKKVILKLEDIVGNSNYLGVGYEYQLGPASDMKSRLGAIGEVFESLSHIVTPVTEETIAETTDVIKKFLEDYKVNECISCQSKFGCLDEAELNIVAAHIASRLEDNKPITREMLPVSCDLAYEMIDQIVEIYGNMKLMRVIKAKEDENNQKLASEYKTVSSLIKNMITEDAVVNKEASKRQKQIREELGFLGYTVYEDFEKEEEGRYFYEFITDILIDIDKAKNDIQGTVSDISGTDMRIKLILNSSKTERSRVKLVPSSLYSIKAIVKQIKRSDSDANGDSYIITELKNNNKVIAISDGMGSGTKSKQLSEAVINMISGMSNGGFSRKDMLDLINRVLKQKENSELSATLDMCVLDESKNVLQFVKMGAVSSFIIDKDVVESVENGTDPLGLFNSTEYSSYEKTANNGMYIVMMSDGANEINSKVMENIVVENRDNLSQEVIMEAIMDKLLGNQNKIMLDDITVIVAKVV